jgi:Icc-related predicted phosphoesterase
LKFVAISDTHCRHNNIKLPNGDVLLHAGDITYCGKKSEVVDFLNWFSRQKFAFKVFIAGNHDFYFENANPKELEEVVPKNVIYLNDSGISIDNFTIWGSPVTPWFYNWAFNRQRGVEIQRHWNLIPGKIDVLLTHGPVYGILDSVINKNSAGCKTLLSTVQKIKPKVHVFGHIHESYGVETRFGVKFINASVLNESYELVNRPVVFDIT